jgi:thioesterase domain-containing protein
LPLTAEKRHVGYPGSKSVHGVANIKFVIEQMGKVQPHADYKKGTMVGHSMGGDISMYFAKQ